MNEFYLLGTWVPRLAARPTFDRTHHVHAFESGSEGLIRHLAFRDYLHAHPEEAAAYADLKIKLAEQCRHDYDGYCDGKHEFVQEREKRALSWRDGAQSSSTLLDASSD